MTPPSVFGLTGLPASSKLDEPISLPEPSAPEIEDDSTIRTVDELVRRRTRQYPDRVIVSYPSDGINYVDYTMRQLDVFAYRVAKVYEQHLPVRKSSEEAPMTVAVIGPSNFDYLITMLALTKLGHTTLFLSTRISQEAIDNLIKTTGAVCLLADPRYLATAEAAQRSIDGLDILQIAGKSSFDFPIEMHADTRLDSHLDLSKETNNRIYIIHSSGSTGLPKPIYQAQRAAVANYASSMNMRAFITLPLYHNHGICNLYRAIYSGKSIHMYNADLPLTHDYLTSIMKTHQFEIFYGVPYALKLLSESELGLSLLADLKIVMYGGSAMPDDLGNLLISRGINLVGHYGATEVGQLMTSFRPNTDQAWNYVRETPNLSPFLNWVSRGPNLFECCVLKGWPSQVASNQEDGSYMTKDLFEPHPTIPKAWKYVARRDDTLNLETGEMFNPVATEGSIRSSSDVQEAVIFGAGRPVPGVLIVPAEKLAEQSEDEILERIWPVVESACRNVEAYARISKSMIKLLPAGCEYPRTDKGSVIRQAFYRTYAKEIDETYEQAEAGGEDLKQFDESELRDFLRQSLTKALTKELAFEDTTDFFSLGLDSLQAIQMRSEILRTVDIRGHKLSQTVAFDHPSIERLSAHLFALSNDKQAEAEVSIETEIYDLIEKYSHKSANVPGATQLSFVVTGASGSLGAHVVAKLVVDPTVSRVYCLVRAKSDHEASARVRSSMIQRRVYHTLSLSHRRKITCYAADLSDKSLGLTPATYDRIASGLNSVIHCAWSVNFNMRLSSFEKSNVAGVANLISLCEATKKGISAAPSASFNFCSSVSTVSKATEVPVPERQPDPSWSQDMGYAQSKTVAEHLCSRAAEQGITARVLRVGQIVADTQHGIWNSTEAIPLMLQTALTIGALPKLQETPSWLPVDTTAESVAQIALSNAGSIFANVANPKTFDWTADLLPALKKAGLEFKELEPQEWVNRLRNSIADPVKNPPIKLVDFFASKYDKTEFGPSKSYVTETACSLAPALANAPKLEQEHVDQFVKFFTNGPWAQSNNDTPAKNTEKTAIFVAGPCGSGKSTLATSLAQKLKVPFVEGDFLHSRENVDKMAAGQALSDQDRTSWLERLAKRAIESMRDLDYPSVLVSCSALRNVYRDALRLHLRGVARVVFLDLQCEPHVLAERLSRRKDHYMPESLLESQLLAYEPPAMSEIDVFPIDAGSSPEIVLEEAVALLAEEHVPIA